MRDGHDEQEKPTSKWLKDTHRSKVGGCANRFNEINLSVRPFGFPQIEKDEDEG
jgi:hypothetical protein